MIAKFLFFTKFNIAVLLIELGVKELFCHSLYSVKINREIFTKHFYEQSTLIRLKTRHIGSVFYWNTKKERLAALKIYRQWLKDTGKWRDYL